MVIGVFYFFFYYVFYIFELCIMNILLVLKFENNKENECFMIGIYLRGEFGEF